MRKAITPIISVVLLIMLVVAITGGAWVWMTGVQGSLEETAGEQVEETGELASTSFSIISAICNSDDTVDLTVMNTGSADISSDVSWLVTVTEVGGTILGTNTTVGDVISTVPEGEATSFTVDGGVDTLSSGTSYTIKINVGNTIRTTTCTVG